METQELLNNFNLSDDVREIFEQCPSFQIVDSIEKLKELSLRNSEDDFKSVERDDEIPF